ncbi:MAG: polyprenyl synthetase family protein [Bacillota bacterium]
MNPSYSWPSVDKDLNAVNEALRGELPLEQASLLGDVARFLCQSKGKGLRATLILLTAHSGRVADWHSVYRAAAAVELTHLATLVHDDLIDQAVLRRGLPAVHMQWTPGVAILTGDYLFARAIALMNTIGMQRLSALLANAISEMCQGEMSQQEQAFEVNLMEAQYLDRIRQKTATFFAVSCAIGALLSGQDERDIQALYGYGEALGLAYQVLDDLLDLAATTEEIGKPVGNDLRHGTITLPMIHALRQERYSSTLARMIMEPESDIGQIRHILMDCGSFGYAHSFALDKIAEARSRLSLLPQDWAVQHLDALAETLLNKHTTHLAPLTAAR